MLISFSMKRLNLLSALILIVLALLLNAAKSGANAPQLPRENPNYPAEQRIQNKPASYAYEQVAENAVTPVGGEHSEDNRKKNSNSVGDQKKADWMVRLTAILCVITFIQALIYWNQYRAMVFSQRAQIVLTPTPPLIPTQTRVVLQINASPNPAPVAALFQPQPQPQQLPLPTLPTPAILPIGLFVFAPNQHSEFRATINNIGNTPAYQLIFDAWIELIPRPFEDFPENTIIGHNRLPRTVYPNTPQWQQSITVKTDHPMSQMEFNEFRQGQRELWVRIRVYYRDAFRRRFRPMRYADFGWRYNNVGMDVISKYQTSN